MWFLYAAFVINGVVLQDSFNPTPFQYEADCQQVIFDNAGEYPISWNDEGGWWIIDVVSESTEDKKVQVYAVCQKRT